MFDLLCDKVGVTVVNAATEHGISQLNRDFVDHEVKIHVDFLEFLEIIIAQTT